MLSEIAQINPRLTGQLDDDELVSFLGMADVSESGETNRGDERPFSAVRKGYTPFLNGDLLVAKITPCFENGKITQAKTDHTHAFGSTEFHVVRVDEARADARYVLHLLRSPHVRTSGEKRMTGSAGQKRVPKAFFESLDIPLPPLPEQRRIADILDRADDLRAKRRRVLAVLDDVTEAALARCLERSHPAHQRLGDLVEEFRYGTSMKSGPMGLPILRIPNVSKRRLSFDDLKYVELAAPEADRLALVEGDLLIVRSNGNADLVGATARFQVKTSEQRFVFASYLIRARLRDPRASVFVERYLASPAGRAALRRGARTSAGQYNINTKSLAALPVPLPDSLALHEFDLIVNRTEKLRSQHLDELAKLDELFASLQHRAFSGQL